MKSIEHFVEMRTFVIGLLALNLAASFAQAQDPTESLAGVQDLSMSLLLLRCPTLLAACCMGGSNAKRYAESSFCLQHLKILTRS